MATFRTTVSNTHYIDWSVDGDGYKYRKESYEPTSYNGAEVNRGVRIPFGERVGNKNGTGCYGIIYIKFAFNVEVVINENPAQQGYGTLRCWFNGGQGPSGYKLEHGAAGAIDMQDDGGGFYDAVGFRFTSSAGVEQTHSLPNVADDTLTRAQNEMNAFVGGDYLGQWFFPDNNYTGGFSSRVATGVSWQRNLTANDFNSDGTLKHLTLANLYHRWYDQPNTNSKVTGLTITLDDKIDVNWLYYPWAIKSGEKWLSCNRDYNAHQSPERTAYLRLKESGNWRDVLNSLQNPDYEHDGWIKKNGVWVRAALYGDNS